ncbi:MAG: radical SAM protein [Phycisphaerae bacterium]|jgi:radical SAM superfamily enzyme YgiQ (UPF0313 family)
MRILLINPPIREWSKPNVLPLGLGYIAAMLQRDGHEVEVMDINAYRMGLQEVESKIKEANFDLVGIGAIVTVYKYVKWLIPLIKKYHPTKKIIVGGSVGTSIPKIVLEKAGADIASIGESENTIVELVRAIETGKSLTGIEGIWFKDSQGNIIANKNRSPITNLDELPYPAWDLFPMDIYLKNPVGAPNKNKWVDGDIGGDAVLSMNITGTRGCPYKCIYCYHDFMGQRYRHRSAENIVKEMKVLYEEYGAEYLHFTDDEFCLKEEFVYDFCKELKKELGGKVTWGCSGRVNLMTEKLISTMAQSGCTLIGYGIESGSQRMLDVMKKNVTVEQAKEAVRLTKKYLGWADCSFIVGIPGENRETVEETVNFCKELDLIPEVIFFATPYPGTELYSLAISQGKIKDEEEYMLSLGEQGEKVRVNFTDFSDEELVQIQEKMIQELKAWNKIKHTGSN